MAEGKLSKTARASLADREVTNYNKPCPHCGESMVATKFIKTADRPGGMFWVCLKDDHSQRT